MPNMDFFDEKELCEIVIIDNDEEFKDFLNSNPCGLIVLPEKHPGCDDLVMKDDAGDFSKWLIQNNPELKVEVRKTDKWQLLRSSDYWLPLVFLASDVTLPFYLSLVANYVYDRMRGALRGERARVHFEAYYEDKEKGATKKFSFHGDVETLQQTIDRFNVDKFYG